ncbi:uncharacterized protein N7529_000052 [Penicillium soppii]|uniref:uncharacterized protein n=1 Tax=Penicillium soppii TaxID=69789 RepID=UPI002547DCBB|nr:uncharacterized protein N7529_000052 [Penicillium soppii]KAJ5881380.1 hypothetical protein N7529_000052 [Penicillium soppii]
MSKFVNKVKDAMTDHNKDAPTAHGFQAPHDENASSNFPTTEYDPNQHKSSSMNESSGMGSNNPYESGAPSDDGPGTYHRDSKFTDNRAQHAGPTNPQNYSYVPSNISSPGQPRTSGLDNHQSIEDDYSKSTQENKSQSRPSDNYKSQGQWNSQESHETSTQEHKSHSATTHTMPCQTNLQNEPGFDERAAEPSFGGNAAGSSSSTSGVRQPSGNQSTDPLNKLDPRANRSNEQSGFADQRSGF